MATSRIDEVKAPQHLKTRRARLLGRLPLRELAQALLARPDGRVHDLEEELALRVRDALTIMTTPSS